MSRILASMLSLAAVAAVAAVAGCGGSAVVTASAGGTGAGAAKSSATPYATTPASGGQVNPRAVPLGDGYISTSPRVGYVDSCLTHFGGGEAQANGPWIDSSTRTWNSLAKIAVRGAVRWPSACYRVTVSGGRRVIRSGDLPVNHATGAFPISSSDPAYRYDRNPNRISAHRFIWSLPLHPAAAAHPSCTGGGPIGVLSDGVVLFNGLDGEGRDAGAHEVLDRCGGHPDQSGTYHHHFIPPCIVNRARNGRSTLIGYALDGFGIYVEKGARGALPGNRGLDACHGRTSRVPWQGRVVRIYHYVATLEYPYSIGCFRGTHLRTCAPVPPAERSRAARVRVPGMTVVVITGATRGIGRAAAIELARQGAEVALVGREGERLGAVAEEATAAGGGAPIHQHVADLLSMAEVRRLADELRGAYDRIDVLANNAGALFASRKLTPEGFEHTFALNHLAPFLLTNLLRDRLSGGRVVTTASDAHTSGRLDLEDLQSERSYSAMRVYGTTKLCNVLFTRELTRRAPELSANCFHPGVVRTGFGKNENGIWKLLTTVGGPFFRSPERGARSLVWLALSDEAAGLTGEYVQDEKVATPSAQARDPELARELWERSAALVRLPAGALT